MEFYVFVKMWSQTIGPQKLRMQSSYTVVTLASVP